MPTMPATALITLALLTGCGSAGGAPTARPAVPTTTAPTATADPYADWVTVPDFVGANENDWVASLRVPPSWRYMPADRTGSNCGTSVCYTGYSDTLQGPGGADFVIGGPTAQVANCTEYAQSQTGGGYIQSAATAITISGTSTTEYTYSRKTGGATYTQYIVPLESSLVGCISLHATGGQPTDNGATIKQILTSITIRSTR